MKKGFTIIELLVVIAIIGLLATVVLTQVPNTSYKANDSKRIQHIGQILTALQIYKSENGNWPIRTADACCDGWDQAPCNGDTTFIQELLDEDAASSVPIDPTDQTGTGCYGFNYYRYGAGSYGCDSARGDFFVLGVRDMESSTRPYADSPGFNCSGRDWQNEFDWVIGGYQY